jgi:hypothetical protein
MLSKLVVNLAESVVFPPRRGQAFRLVLTGTNHAATSKSPEVTIIPPLWQELFSEPFSALSVVQ